MTLKNLPELKTIPTADLVAPDRWAAELAAAETWTAQLAMPFAAQFDQAKDPEVSATAGLQQSRAMIRKAARRRMEDFRANPDAYKHLRRLPKDGESLHGVINGRYALWEMVPALMERTGAKIRDLYLATLTFSKANAGELLTLLDAGQIRRVALLVSCYFKVQNRGLYDALVPQLIERRQRVLAMRTHCKIILAHMTDGSRFVCESSANLRSAKTLEQFVLTRDARLYAFHRRWMAELFAAPHE